VPRRIEPARLAPRAEERFVHELFRLPLPRVPDRRGQIGEQEECVTLLEVLPGFTVAERGMLEQNVVSAGLTHRDRVASRSRPPTCGYHRERESLRCRGLLAGGPPAEGPKRNEAETRNNCSEATTRFPGWTGEWARKADRRAFGRARGMVFTDI